jgi:dUTPase
MLFPKTDKDTYYGTYLTNAVSVVGPDYNSDNEGHILIRLENSSDENIWLATGDVFAQGIFLPFAYADK